MTTQPLPSAPTAAGRRVAVDRSRQALFAALVLILSGAPTSRSRRRSSRRSRRAGFLFARYLIMPVAATLLLCLRFGTHRSRVSRADAWALLRLGLIGHVLHVGMVTYGIHWSTAFSSSRILACGPVFTLLILHWHGLEELTRGQIAGVGVACLGVVALLSNKLFGGHWQAGAGDLVLLVAASFFSYYTVVAKPLIERLGGVVVMTYAALFQPAGRAPESLGGPCRQLERGLAGDLGRDGLRRPRLGLHRLARLGLGQTACTVSHAPRRSCT